MSSISQENQMKAALSMALVSFMLLLGGCNLAPQPAPAAQGPAGQPGQTGQTGQPGQSGETGQTGKAGDQGQVGQTGQTGDTGQQGQTGEQGKAAPCPSGQHRRTTDSGRVICVDD